MHARTHKCLCISVCSSFICATTWLFTDIIRKGGKEEKAKQVKSHFSCTSCVVLYVTSLHFFHLLLDIASKRVFTDNSALIHYPDLLCNPAYKVLIVTDDDHRTYYSTLRSKRMGQKKRENRSGAVLLLNCVAKTTREHCNRVLCHTLVVTTIRRKAHKKSTWHTFKRFYTICQGSYRLQVQIIGRFVQDQHMWPAVRNLCVRTR